MKKFRVNLMEILNDHRSNLIELVDEAHASSSTFGDTIKGINKRVETEHDRMITEVNELLGSSYE